MVTICVNVGYMIVNKMVDKKIPKDVEDSKECGKFEYHTWQETMQHAFPKGMAFPAPHSVVTQLLILPPARHSCHSLRDGGEWCLISSCLP